MRVSLRAALLILVLLGGASAALAHVPAGPVLHCQAWPEWTYHDYLPPHTGSYMRAEDGAMDACERTGGDPAVCRALNDAEVDNHPDLDVAWETLCASHEPFLGFDGDLDHGYGGVILAVDWASYACYGIEPHHGRTIYAQDTPGSAGPPLIIASDFGRFDDQECGDDIIEPCDPQPEPPSPQPFPLNVVEDTVNSVVYDLLVGPGGVGCNPLDCLEGIHGSFPGPTTITPLCGPGEDGAYRVFVNTVVDENTMRAHIPLAGHIWG